MKKTPYPSTVKALNIIALVTVVATLGAGLFTLNARNCLDRDFVEKALPAVCWRQTNDYESTIRASEGVHHMLMAISTVTVLTTLIWTLTHLNRQ